MHAERAVAIDPTLAEPHASLGMVNRILWQWSASENEFRRAIELNPTYPTSYQWYSVLLRDLGRYDEAAVMVKRAQELDPLSALLMLMLRSHKDREKLQSEC
jgi:tetratricopeptide (TPR) repeat protein